MELTKEIGDTTRKWLDYQVITSPYDGSKFLRQYVERFSTVSFFNEYAGLLSYYYILAASLAPYVRIPIHGSLIADFMYFGYNLLDQGSQLLTSSCLRF